MKIKTFKKYDSKNFQLKLYKKTPPVNFAFTSKQTEFYLKKILHIIYKFHIADKKILFLEFPEFFNQTLKNTKHITIQNHFNYTEFLSKMSTSLNNSTLITKIPLNTVKSFLKLHNRIDLTFMCDLEKDYLKNVFIKTYKSKTPTISSHNRFELKPTYEILTHHKSLNEKILNNNFLLVMVQIALKKAISHSKYKKKNYSTNLNELNKQITFRNHFLNHPNPSLIIYLYGIN